MTKNWRAGPTRERKTQTRPSRQQWLHRLCTCIQGLGCAEQAQTFHKETWLIWHCPQQTGNLRLSIWQLTEKSAKALWIELRIQFKKAFCLFQKGVCVCVCPHMGANFLKEWLLGTRISLATVETLFYQVAGIPRTSLLSITPGNKTGKNRCPRKVKTHALKTLTL